MEHVVFWSAHSGALEFARVSQLPEAVELVERLRNSDGITDATVHALTDVPVGFRTYYVAEVGGGSGSGDAPDGAPSIAPSVVHDAPSTVAAPAADLAAPAGEGSDAQREVAHSDGAADQASAPALSVVPDMLETSPEPEADPSQPTADEAGAAPADGFPRSLGLFA